MKLLCVDSEPVYREIISLCAESVGAKVKSVDCFDEALHLFTDYDPDIVILDVIIKGGSGIDLAKRMKALSGNRFVPIIFLASQTSDAVMGNCFRCGADDFIPKPFSEILFNIRLKTHMRHVELIKEMYRKNKALTYYQTMIEREHEMAHHVLNHIQTRSERNSEHVAITRLSAASFNGDLALVKTRSDGARLAFVGDFTGHGLPASIGALPVMQAFFDAVDDLLDIGKSAERINRILISVLPDYMFCAGYLVLVTTNGEIFYWGGGMPNAFIHRSDGGLNYLRSKHMPLGILPEREFDADIQNDQLDEGDTLVIMSDGVLELKNISEKMLGNDGVEAIINTAYAEKSLITAQKTAEKKLAEYQGESIQLDDITLLALRRTCLQ